MENNLSHDEALKQRAIERRKRITIKRINLYDKGKNMEPQKLNLKNKSPREIEEIALDLGAKFTATTNVGHKNDEVFTVHFFNSDEKEVFNYNVNMKDAENVTFPVFENGREWGQENLDSLENWSRIETKLDLLEKWESNLAVKGPDAGLSGLKFFPTTIEGAVRATNDEFGLTFDVSKKSRDEWLVFVFDRDNSSLSYYDGKASSQGNGIHQAGIFMQALKENQFLKENGLSGEGSTQNAYNTLRYDTSENIDEVEQKLMDLGYTKDKSMKFPHGDNYIVDRVSNNEHPDFGKHFIQWEMQETPIVFSNAISNITQKLIQSKKDLVSDFIRDAENKDVNTDLDAK